MASDVLALFTRLIPAQRQGKRPENSRFRVDRVRLFRLAATLWLIAFTTTATVMFGALLTRVPESIRAHDGLPHPLQGGDRLVGHFGVVGSGRGTRDAGGQRGSYFGRCRCAPSAARDCRLALCSAYTR